MDDTVTPPPPPPRPGFGHVQRFSRIWSGTGQSRRDRKPYRYDACIPPLIGSAELVISGATSQACEVAALAIHDLNFAGAIEDLEAIAAPLLRSESVASSRIENLRVSHRRVAEALEDPRHAKQTALEVARNLEAMKTALRLADSGDALSIETIKVVHKTLLAHTRDAQYGGIVRDEQNWIGGSNWGPRGALYVPPPHELVSELVEDLTAFANRTDVPPIAQAAIAHAQFEAIHPFVDGNGRTGRCLVHIILRRRAIAPVIMPPISAALAVHRDAYFAGLAGYQQRGETEPWIAQFAGAATEAVVGARQLVDSIVTLREAWRAAAGRPRRDSIASRFLDTLPSTPLLSAESAARHLDVDPNVARRGIRRLEEAGVLKQVSKGERNRVWAADDVFDLLDEFEHTLTEGNGPTRHLR